jgi:hypothetical protein
VKNLTVSDISGYSKDGFKLYSGVLDKLIPELNPGESFTYFYILERKAEGVYLIPSASIEYDYLYVRNAVSNTLLVKVREVWPITSLLLTVPLSLGLFITAGLYWWKHRYDRESMEFKRREELIFGTDYRSISWEKYVIEEHLKTIIEGGKITKKRTKEEVF